MDKIRILNADGKIVEVDLEKESDDIYCLTCGMTSMFSCVRIAKWNYQ